MNRRHPLVAAAILVATAPLASCSQGGLFHYLTQTDIIESIGNGRLYLRSSATGTDIVIFGPTPEDGTPAVFLAGSVARDSSTQLQLGSAVLDGSGNGEFTVTAEYNFPFQPEIDVSGRDGSTRTDLSPGYDVALRVTQLPDGHLEVSFDGEEHEYTPYSEVVAAIDPSDPAGITDIYQLYNIGLFFSQVRIPAFGSIGMSRYITQTGHFTGLIGGEFDVAVKSFADATVTMTYRAMEDFPGEIVDGEIITAANFDGDGPMRGVMHYTFEGGTDLAPVVLTGTVDYEDIVVGNGMAVSGNYAVTITSPVVASGLVPYTVATQVDLRHVLPETP